MLMDPRTHSELRGSSGDRQVPREGCPALDADGRPLLTRSRYGDEGGEGQVEGSPPARAAKRQKKWLDAKSVRYGMGRSECSLLLVERRGVWGRSPRRNVLGVLSSVGVE